MLPLSLPPPLNCIQGLTSLKLHHRWSLTWAQSTQDITNIKHYHRQWLWCLIMAERFPLIVTRTIHSVICWDHFSPFSWESPSLRKRLRNCVTICLYLLGHRNWIRDWHRGYFLYVWSRGGGPEHQSLIRGVRKMLECSCASSAGQMGVWVGSTCFRSFF